MKRTAPLMVAAFLFCAAQSSAAEGPRSSPQHTAAIHATGKHGPVIVEWAPFTIMPGTDETMLVKASDDIQNNFIGKQRGFIKRELLKGKDGRWVDIVYWSSREDAELAGRNAMESPVCAAYFGLMATVDHNDPNAGVWHYERIKAWK